MWQEIVRQWLTANGLSQSALARRLNMADTQLSHLMTGQDKPSDDMLRRLESAMSLPTGTLRRDETVKA